MEAVTLNIEQHFTLSEIAEKLNISTRTLRRWIDAGRLRATEVPGRGRKGKEYRVPASALRELGFKVKEDKSKNK